MDNKRKIIFDLNRQLKYIYSYATGNSSRLARGNLTTGNIFADCKTGNNQSEFLFNEKYYHRNRKGERSAYRRLELEHSPVDQYDTERQLTRITMTYTTI